MDASQLAQAVEGAVFESLLLAMGCNQRGDSAGEVRWFKHADKLEQKFITQHGRHYAAFLPRQRHRQKE